MPDRLAAVPWQVWPFLVIAALQIWNAVPSLREAASEPEQIFVTLAGLLARWALATAAGLATIAIQTPLAWLWFSRWSTLTVLVFLGGPALLLVAFLVGLPSTQPAEAADTAADPGSRSDASGNASGDAAEPSATADGSGPDEDADQAFMRSLSGS